MSPRRSARRSPATINNKRRAADSSEVSSTSASVREQTAPLAGKVNSPGLPNPKTPSISKSPAPSESDQPGGADSLSKCHTQPIRAELHCRDTAAALGITATGNTPVLRLCRVLVDAGRDPATPLEALDCRWWRPDRPRMPVALVEHLDGGCLHYRLAPACLRRRPPQGGSEEGTKPAGVNALHRSTPNPTACRVRLSS
jgi:hypothetical protein